MIDWSAARAHTYRQTDTQTDRHTSNEHIVSAIHFVHLAEIKIRKEHGANTQKELTENTNPLRFTD